MSNGMTKPKGNDACNSRYILQLQCQNFGKIFTSPMYNFLSGLTVISEVYRCLRRQYMVNFTGLVGVNNAIVYKTESIFTGLGHGKLSFCNNWVMVSSLRALCIHTSMLNGYLSRKRFNTEKEIFSWSHYLYRECITYPSWIITHRIFRMNFHACLFWFMYM